MTRPLPRLGAPAAAAVALLVVLGLTPARSTFALDEMIKPLVDSQTIRFRSVARKPGAPPRTAVGAVSGQKWRQVDEGRGVIRIGDESEDAMLTLYPEEKRASLLTVVNRPADQRHSQNFLEFVREKLLQEREDRRFERKPLGEREAGGRELIGFRLTGGGSTLDLWGDKASGAPFSVEVTMEAMPDVAIALTDFEFDVELDPSLFSLTAPEGYELSRQTLDMSAPQQ